MWHYSQSTGFLDKDGVLVSKTCYSGCQGGKNNPKAEAIPDWGPIPQGLWKIQGPPQNTAQHGPYVLELVPDKTTVTYGRSGFLIHGDSIEHPGEASLGCIIADRITRGRIWQSGDYDLTVISGE